MNRILKDKVNKLLVITIIVICFFVVLVFMFKYKNEGETNMPFVLDEIMVVSSADAVSKNKENDTNSWNLTINQYNDFYIYVKKNDEYSKNAFIKRVSIENIKINNPQKGNVEVYMPSTDEKKLFEYTDNLKVSDSLTFNGGSKTDPKTLSIANQGGNIIFRVVNRNVAEFENVFNDANEVIYDGTLLKKTNTNIDEIRFSMSFDIVIETDKNTYRGTKTITLPFDGVDIDGISKNIDYECKDIIFKRNT